ncbi:DUF4142 domain-containing protein [Pedobacter rhodius]|uniref:DUF4142 domain-containing protein n=1 Tax=Pedobacter rhodius TaxID=3004098 RepID=A0ABT4KV28_9SPHI|nr:DUF4142 domain-containing protein [Pedobacter sp. SJ11]MCZ4222625.1 DUF4142 domain-containing protein [Pedobacter sp. SJ11]
MKNQILYVLGVGILSFTVKVDAKSPSNFMFEKSNLKQNTDSTAVLISSAYVINTKQLELSGLAVKNANAKTKGLAKNLSDYFIKSNAKLRTFAKQKDIAMPMTKPQGGMRPDGRIDSAPENMRDTSRNEPGTGEAGNTGISGKSSVKPEVMQSILSLSKLKGSDFNKAYLNYLGNDINQLISLYGKLAQSTDTALKAFAQNQLSQLNNFTAQLK